MFPIAPKLLIVRIFAIALLFTCLMVSPCHAQTIDNTDRCVQYAISNPDLGLQYCTAAIQAGNLSPSDLATYYSNRGVAYAQKGDFDHAIQDYDHAISLNPALTEAFANCGNAYLNKGDNDSAIQNYDQAIRLSPNSANAYNGRGNAYKKKGDCARAIQDLDQSIRLNPDDSQPFY